MLGNECFAFKEAVASRYDEHEWLDECSKVVFDPEHEDFAGQVHATDNWEEDCLIEGKLLVDDLRCMLRRST